MSYGFAEVLADQCGSSAFNVCLNEVDLEWLRYGYRREPANGVLRIEYKKKQLNSRLYTTRDALHYMLCLVGASHYV